MINQPFKKVNDSVKTLLTYASIQEIYDLMMKPILAHNVTGLILPCCGLLAFMSYSLFGKYKRRVRDLVYVVKNGKRVLKEQYVTINIQRIICNHCEADEKIRTHALLFHLFVPYGEYSVRYILYYLRQYMVSHQSIDDFCEGKPFSVQTFKKWLRWLKDNAMDLDNTITMLDMKRDRVKDTLKQLLERMMDDFPKHLKKVLIKYRNLLFPFQDHATPPHTVKILGNVAVWR